MTAAVELIETASPYLGLRPFEREDAPYFFGRSTEIGLLAANLRNARTSLVYGESGVGKSSLLRAGLVPELEARAAEADEDREAIKVVSLTLAREDPRARLAAALGAPERDYGLLDLERIVLRALRRADRVLIVLDQFEEYLAYVAATDDESFAAEFLSVVTDERLPVHFMLGIREDSVARLDVFGARSRALLAIPIRIDPLTTRAAEEAIRGPLDAYNDHRGTHFELAAGFAETVLDATRPGALDLGVGGRGGIEQDVLRGDRVEAPYLQLVLQAVWRAERARDSTRLRPETLERLGGLAGVFRRHLDDIMDQLGGRERRAAARAFEYLVTPSGMKVPYSSFDLAKLTGLDVGRIEPVLERLSSPRNRIVRPIAPAAGRSEPRYEIYHDRLAEPILDWRARQTEGAERSSFTAVVAISCLAGVAVLLGSFIVTGGVPQAWVSGFAVAVASLSALQFVVLFASRLRIRWRERARRA